jgi:hypothetical protein
MSQASAIASSPLAGAAGAAGGSTDAASQSLVKAALYEKDQTAADGVTFQFNPKSIKIVHGASTGELGVRESDTTDQGSPTTSVQPGSTSLTAQQELEKAGKTSLSLDSLVFDGAMNVQKYVGMLLNWSYPIYQKTVTGTKTSTNVYLQELVFSWGDFTLGLLAPKAISVVMTSCTVSYERFTSSGLPIRATVTLALQPLAQNPMKQNPTSGGLPDRRGRMLISGETLPGIAVAEYGRPGDWRRLAEANQIDDPLRVRPGSVLYLPSRAELAGGRPA